METGLRIVIVSPPGRTCDSLVALIRTLRPAELFPLAPHQLSDGSNLPAAPHLALVDLAGMPPAEAAQTAAAVRRRWPEVRLLALVETMRLSGGPAQQADCILHRSVAGSDLLDAVQRLAHGRPLRPTPAFPVQTGVAGGRKL